VKEHRKDIILAANALNLFNKHMAAAEGMLALFHDIVLKLPNELRKDQIDEFSALPFKRVFYSERDKKEISVPINGRTFQQIRSQVQQIQTYVESILINNYS